IFAAVDLMAELGLGADQVRVKISHRQTVRHILSKLGVSDEKMDAAFGLLDQRDKIDADEFVKKAGDLGMGPGQVERFDQTCRFKYGCGELDQMREHLGIDRDLGELEALDTQLEAFGIGDWCEYDVGIVRGLAYYTGTVFEIHEVSGAERAMAGGGRYDRLIELFDGPPTPAVGFGMGDVVLTNVLRDKGLVPESVAPRPDAFVISLSDAGDEHVAPVTAQLRGAGLHARFSYKTTRNPGKLLKEADQAGARYSVILDDKAASGTAELKEMASGDQREVSMVELAGQISRD
ncbi:MAG: ATP phosphoribosyltransferase regulatory subunit, partial [Phycisphaeraceae bacterium]|nr:ATP phosphoribosyltransferase regulatory subunit [Phycisphaeraceae bacterium]